MVSCDGVGRGEDIDDNNEKGSPSNSDDGYDNESAEIDRNIADRQSSIAEDKEGEGIDKIASVM